MASFFNWMDIVKDLEPGPALPLGMSRRGVVLGEVMLGLHEAVPNLKSTPHRHPSAQITYILKGKMGLSIDGEERVLSPGEFGYIPPNALHGIESFDEDVLALDIFSPPRPDILKRLDTVNLVAQGKIKPVIGAHFHLSEINEAAKHLEEGDVVGRIILTR